MEMQQQLDHWREQAMQQGGAIGTMQLGGDNGASNWRQQAMQVATSQQRTSRGEHGRLHGSEAMDAMQQAASWPDQTLEAMQQATAHIAHQQPRPSAAECVHAPRVRSHTTEGLDTPGASAAGEWAWHQQPQRPWTPDCRPTGTSVAGPPWAGAAPSPALGIFRPTHTDPSSTALPMQT